MDSWDWSAGHKYKYGLPHTNSETMERMWKKSAYWYRDSIARMK